MKDDLNIETYQFNRKYEIMFINLLTEMYGDKYSEKIAFIKSKNNPIYKRIKFRNFIYKSITTECLGHITAFFYKNNQKIGYIGFYESIKDYKISDLLIRKVEEFLKKSGCNKIIVTNNFNNLYQSKICNNQRLFNFDPISQYYYKEQFYKRGYKDFIKYVSAERDNLNRILMYLSKSKIDRNYRINTVRKDNYINYLNDIYDIVSEIWRKSFTKSEFNYNYSYLLSRIPNFIIYLVYYKNIPIAICFNLIENGKLIIKTIGVLKEHRNKGIGDYLIYISHKLAEKNNSRVIYAIMDLKSLLANNKHPKDYKILKEYSILYKEL